MARIRSIKPDFFTSEVICGLPLSARLTFIGLWTHVDDNGVTPDNERLIVAALWPLEEDPRETLQRTHEDLAKLSAVGLIVRYEANGKRLLFVRSWDEHQKVSHPGKPRYTRPSADALSSENAPPTEPLPTSSGDSPEALRPEQGAGSREQGAGSREQGAGSRETRKRAVASDDDPDFSAFWTAYPRKTDKGHGRSAWVKALKTGVDPQRIIAAAGAFAEYCTRERTDPKFIAMPATWLNGERWSDERPAARASPNGHWPSTDIAMRDGAKPSTAVQRAGAGLEIANRLRQQREEAERDTR